MGWEEFSKNFLFEVGAGDRVKLWTDQWCGDSPLKLIFLSVYEIASNKEASVASSLDRLGIGERRSWGVRFIQRPNDWEMGGVEEFLCTLASNLPPNENGDRLRWKLTKNEDFDFSKTAGRIKEATANLPVVTEDDDRDEAAALQDETESTDEDGAMKQDVLVGVPAEEHLEESDPFGLDAMLSTVVKKGFMKGKKDATAKINVEVEENKRFIKSQREALITCLEIAARRYKTPWCQTVIDILVKHAFDNVARFTTRQRDAIEKLWASIREQQTRRKQGKSVNGKLDVNGFEWLQQKYSTKKISIRHSVGGSGDRRAQQWLG
ncbi:uncharacterized protein LOC142628642 [Castanea sativa]|uniref:uncharacterized protein LOC142628642 n=1 Tax=Castanea sativa TaxID=21020 RepID=UPI003F652FA5